MKILPQKQKYNFATKIILALASSYLIIKAIFFEFSFNENEVYLGVLLILIAIFFELLAIFKKDKNSDSYKT